LTIGKREAEKRVFELMLEISKLANRQVQLLNKMKEMKKEIDVIQDIIEEKSLEVQEILEKFPLRKKLTYIASEEKTLGGEEIE